MYYASFDWPRIGGLLDFPPQRFVLVNSKDDPELLLRMLQSEEFPTRCEVFTHELSLTGARAGNLGRAALREKTIRDAERFEKLLLPFQKVAKEKKLRLWLGHPLLDGEKLYIAYSLIDGKKVLWTHRKKFLYKTDRWLFNKPDSWDGNYSYLVKSGSEKPCEVKLSVLLCSEATAFFDPWGWSNQTKIPELREHRPPLVVIPAHWVGNKSYLTSSARAISVPYQRKIYDNGVLIEKGVRPEGSIAFIVNSGECHIVGPYFNPARPRQKTAVYRSLKRPGFIFVSPYVIHVFEMIEMAAKT